MFTAKWEEGTENNIYSLVPDMNSPPIINTPHQSGTFVTMDDPTLTPKVHSLNYGHPRSIVYIRVHAWGACSIGLDKCIMTCI